MATHDSLDVIETNLERGLWKLNIQVSLYTYRHMIMVYLRFFYVCLAAQKVYVTESSSWI